MRSTIFITLGLLALSACGEAEMTGMPATTGAAHEGTGPFLAFAVGNTWKYRVSHPTDGVSEKTNTVEALEPVGGTGPHKDVMAYRIRTQKGDDQTLSWQRIEGDKVVRYREQSFTKGTMTIVLEEHWAPGKLRVDGSPEHVKEGARWTETYTETKVPRGSTPIVENHADTWVVEKVNEQITTPKGTFSCIRVKKTGSSPDANKTWWYARGVGKVKETGGQTEDLVEFTLR